MRLLNTLRVWGALVAFLCLPVSHAASADSANVTWDARGAVSITAQPAVAAGPDFSLYLDAIGTVWAVGDNDSGQLADGSSDNICSIPKPVMSGVQMIAAGDSHSLFLKTDGSVWASGDNWVGQLGDGTYDNKSTPVQVMTGVQAISAGDTHSLFLKTDGTVWATGANYRGQLGIGEPNLTFYQTAAPVQVMAGVKAISAGKGFLDGHSLFLKTDGSVWATGANSDGQLGNGSNQDQYLPVSIMSDVQAISAGEFHSVFLKTDGSAWATGLNANGQLSDGTFISKSSPVLVMTGVKAISAGYALSLFLKTDGKAYASGEYVGGESADGFWQPSATPIFLIQDVSVISAGDSHVLFLKTDDSVWSVGSNGDARLGDGSYFIATPVQVMTGVKSIAPGATSHSMFLKTDGSAWAVGANHLGYLGDGSRKNRSIPVQVMTAVKAIALGEEHSLFLKMDGSVWATGGNWAGQLGDETFTEKSSPVQVMTGVQAIAAGVEHSLFLKNDGTVWATGYNGEGQLGDGQINYVQAEPVQVISGVKAIAAGDQHSFFLKSNGDLWGTGLNDEGQLGDGTTESQFAPIYIMSGVQALAAPHGGDHSLILKTDGSVWGTGRNSSGQLGDGTLVQKNLWVQIMTGVKAVAQGSHHSLFLKTDNTVWATGSNSSGELGTGDTVNQKLPVQVMSNVQAMGCGEVYSLFLKTDGTAWATGGQHNGILGNGVGLPSLTPVRAFTAALVSQPFNAAESGLSQADGGLVNLSPIDKFSVVTGAAAHSGGDALKLQTVDNGTTYAERTIAGPALVDFWWRVSSEDGYDFFGFSLNGVVQQTISGNGTWLNRSLTLGAGSHTLRWSYTKDSDSANFDDAGYLDDLVVLPAYTNLQVKSDTVVLTGSSTLNYGTVLQNAAEVTQTIELKNTGTLSLNVAASLPAGSGFVFDTQASSSSFTLAAGSSKLLGLVLKTSVPGAKSALLTITAAGSQTAAPAITLSGNVQGATPNMACNWSGGALANGQSSAVDFGVTPNDLSITVSNSGTGALTIASVSVSPATDFQLTSQPAASVASNGSTSFTLRALDANRGIRTATVTIASNDPNTPSFSFPVTSQSYLAPTGTGFVSGSFTNTGTSAGWSTAAVTLPGGGSGQALKTGSTPDNGTSSIGATFDGPGLLCWNWQVSSQANYDWLVCEVDGVEVAGISMKAAAWQSQAVSIPAGAQVRWIYRKDGSSFSGTDTGYVSDIYFSKFAAAQSSFQDWSAAHGNLAPTQQVPGGMQAMFAWLGGVNPATGPGVGQFQPSVSGGRYRYRYTISKAAAGKVQPQVSTDLITWRSRNLSQTLISEDATSAVVELSVPASGKVFSRMTTELPAPAAPTGFSLIPSGSFTMGDTLDGDADAPTHTVNVSAFYIAQNLVTKTQWNTVRTWAISNGYSDLAVGAGKASNHPVQTISWFQMVKWCNARSQQEGLTPVYYTNDAQTTVYKTGDVNVTNAQVKWTANGYRLPTEAEWEKAARGGLSSKRFPWGDTISQNQANYSANSIFSYDLSGAVNNYHPTYATGSQPYTSPVGSFVANGYGLNDMAGNVWQWCWDWYGTYDTGSPTDPRGVSLGAFRVFRGGGWGSDAGDCWVANRDVGDLPSATYDDIGFRVARSSVP